jgi:hypothetical protein
MGNAATIKNGDVQVIVQETGIPTVNLTLTI